MDTDKQKDDREQWVQIITKDIDILFWRFEGKLIGAAAAVAGVTATAGRTALAVLAAPIVGLDTSFSKNVLKQQTMATLFDAAEADRVAVDASLVAGLKLQVTDYSLAIASRDVMRYALAGLLNIALASISRKVGT